MQEHHDAAHAPQSLSINDCNGDRAGLSMVPKPRPSGTRGCRDRLTCCAWQESGINPTTADERLEPRHRASAAGALVLATRGR